MAPSAYAGAVALAASKHASPSHIHDSVLPTRPSYQALLQALIIGNGFVAVKEQIETSSAVSVTSANGASTNTDTQPSGAETKFFNENLDEDTANADKFEVESSTHAHKLLLFLRDRINGDMSSDAKQQSSHLTWNDLKEIFTAVKAADTALPGVEDNQDKNMSFALDGKMDELTRDTQDQLTLQLGKVATQDSVTREHQSSSEVSKEPTGAQLNDPSELRKRLSSVIMEKGLIRDDLKKTKKELSESKASYHKTSAMVESLRCEYVMIQDENENLAAKNNALLVDIKEMHGKVKATEEKVKAAELKISHKYDEGLRKMKEALAREEAKVTKVEQDRYELEKKLLDQGNAFSVTMKKLNAETAYASKSAADAAQSQKELAEAKGRIEVLIVHEKNNKALKLRVDELEKRVLELNKEVKKLEKMKEELEEENNQLVNDSKEHRKQSVHYITLENQHKELTKAVTVLKEEKAVILAERELVKEKTTSIGVELEAVRKQALEYETSIVKLNKENKNWSELGNTTIDKYNLAVEKFHKDTEEKDQTIKGLRQKLQAADVVQFHKDSEAKDKTIEDLRQQLQEDSKMKGEIINDLRKKLQEVDTAFEPVSGGHAAYWKKKYELLLGSSHGH